MKSINILSLIQAHNTLEEDSFNRYSQHHSVKIKPSELKDIESLVTNLYELTDQISIFDKFYVGYKIPQIGKEFDLLRFGEEYLVNIELKRTSTEEKIKKQLIRNKYYLSYIGKEIYNLCFVSSTQSIYILNENETLEFFDLHELEKLLNNQIIHSINDIDKLFNPSDYLVSPFNATDKFLSRYYFLTNHQEYVKTELLKSLDTSVAEFISVVGAAGTGKTLLIYDFVQELLNKNKKPLIIHCGYLNEGHKELNSHGWNIIPIKNYSTCNLADYDVIVIDEAQRIYPKQLSGIVTAVRTSNGKCIFSYDKLQTLAKSEEKNNIDGKINEIQPLTTYKLSKKIRTNKEIADFIRMLFDSKRNLPFRSKDNITINYFQNLDDARSYLDSLDSKEWELLKFTPSQYQNEHHKKYSLPSNKTSHEVIGQEFDGVAITIDRYFTYNEDGGLVYRAGTYYHSVNMLFQNITRARKRVNLVIINNEELLNRCMSILQ